MLGIDGNHRQWWILGATGGVLGLILLDETVVGVALPTIRDDLGMSQVESHWVVNAYLLVFTGLAAAGGRLGDLIGHRSPFLAAVALFGLSSLACGFAGDGYVLIAARAIQGIGAAVIFPISLAIVSIAFPPERRGFALGVFGAVGTVFLALGPLVGGILIHALSWRWIFWVNPPLTVLVGAVIAAAWTDPPRKESAKSFDTSGLVLLAGGLAMFIFALMQGPEWGWSDPTIPALLAAGIVLLATFVFVERRRQAPLIDIRLFRHGTFTASNFIIFTAFFTQMVIVVFGAMYLQDELGMQPLIAGLALLAVVGLAPFVSTPVGNYVDRLGPRPVGLAGLAAVAVAMLWIGIASVWDSYVALLPALLVMGAGLPALFTAPRRAAFNAVPIEHQGETGGILMTSQLLGGTMAIAVCGTLLATARDFQPGFLTGAGVAFAVLAIAWRAFDRQADA
jgi:EmrB/QacA subfamily drug resistance transporter